MTEFPFADTQRRAAILSSEGRQVYQKFRCARCGKLTVRKMPGLFLEAGVCDKPKCGWVTDLRRTGCNFEVK